MPAKYQGLMNEMHRVHTLFCLNYVSGSYSAGNVYKCLNWFSSLYYCGHVEMFAVILIGALFFPKKSKKAVGAPAGDKDAAKKTK